MEKLSYEGFKYLLMEELDKRYPDMEKTSKEIVKINEKKQGIIIECANGICATIYPENLYQVYRKVFEETNFIEHVMGRVDSELQYEFEETDLMGIVLESVDSALKYEFVKEYKSMLYKWDDVKQYVKPFVFNLEKNREYIEHTQIVFKERLNLAYSCFVEFPEDEEGDSAQVNITQGLLELWGVSEQEIFEAAERNAIFNIKSMREVIEELIKNKVGVEADLEEKTIMYVISNEKRHRGAAGLFQTELLEKHAEELDDNLYIIPSSLHEVILVKEDDAPPVEVLKDMVHEVNETQVNIEDYMSDNIYYYDREKKELKIVG